MLKHEVVLPPEHLYPPDEWRLVEARFTDEYASLAETSFSLGNGFVGIRGCLDEGRPALSPETYVNGFHETWPIAHLEEAAACPDRPDDGHRAGRDDPAALLDDEPLFMPTARVRGYARVLDMRAGTLTRELVWSPALASMCGSVHVGSSRCSTVTWSR